MLRTRLYCPFLLQPDHTSPASIDTKRRLTPRLTPRSAHPLVLRPAALTLQPQRPTAHGRRLCTNTTPQFTPVTPHLTVILFSLTMGLPVTMTISMECLDKLFIEPLRLPYTPGVAAGSSNGHHADATDRVSTDLSFPIQPAWPFRRLIRFITADERTLLGEPVDENIDGECAVSSANGSRSRNCKGPPCVRPRPRRPVPVGPSIQTHRRACAGAQSKSC